MGVLNHPQHPPRFTPVRAAYVDSESSPDFVQLFSYIPHPGSLEHFYFAND